jgi:hypothetical protein
MRSMLFAAFLALAGPACVDSPADDDPAADCVRYREHSIELSLRAARDVGGADLTEADIAAHRAQMSTALAAAYETRCGELTQAQLDCSLGANTSTELATCTGGDR